MTKRPWYKRYPSNWLSGVMGLSAEERGVYDTIIDLLYDRGAPIPDDDKELARITGCSSIRRYRAVKARLVSLRKVTVADGLVSNPRFERDLPASEDEAEKFAESGRRSGEVRRRNGERSGQTTPEPPPITQPELFETKGLAEKGLEHTRDQRLETREGSKSGRAKRRAPRAMVRPDWSPNDRDLAYARSKHFDEPKVAEMVRRFVNHHRSRGTLIADLAATWETWCDNEVKFTKRDGERVGRRGASGPSIYDIAAGRQLDGGNR